VSGDEQDLGPVGGRIDGMHGCFPRCGRDEAGGRGRAAGGFSMFDDDWGIAAD